MLFHPELSARDMLLIYSRAMVVEAFLSPLGFARCRERATFLCLCHCAARGANGEAGPKGERGARVKKEWPKESTPHRLRPALRAGSAGFAGFFDSTSLYCRKTRDFLSRALRA
jgi:hypothetical protein